MKKEILKKLAEKYEIILIYIFGSQAEKAKRYLEGEKIIKNNFSDLDIAIAFEKPKIDIKIFGKIYMELSEIFEPFEIDLIFMHEVDPLFQYEIIKGEKIYEKNEFLTDEIEERIMKLAGDLQFKKKIFDEEVMEAIENGYFELEYRPNS